jgi:hypothetical protein
MSGASSSRCLRRGDGVAARGAPSSRRCRGSLNNASPELRGQCSGSVAQCLNRARPTSLEAVHFPLQAAQAVSDCSQFAHHAPLFYISILTDLGL